MDKAKNSRIWKAILPALVIPFFSSLIYFVLLTGKTAQLIYGLTKGFILLWPILITYLYFKERLPRVNWFDSRHVKAIGGGILSGGLVAGVVFFLLQTGVFDILKAAAPAIRARTEPMGFLQHYWLFTIFLSVFHSFIEEYYWRWFVFGHLRHVVRTGPAILISSAAFSSHHIIILSQFFPPMVAWIFGGLIGGGGVMWCIMYQRQKTLLGAWISHMIIDFAVMAVGYMILF